MATNRPTEIPHPWCGDELPMDPMTATIQRIRLDRAGYDNCGSYYGVGRPLFLVTTCDREGKIEGTTHRGERATIAQVIRQCGYRIVR